jgi:hypothetical protein
MFPPQLLEQSAPEPEGMIICKIWSMEQLFPENKEPLFPHPWFPSDHPPLQFPPAM